MTERYKIVVPPEAEGQRLDTYLSKHSKIPSRTFAQRLISQSLVKVDNKVVSKHHKLMAGEIITLEIPPPVEGTIIPEKIPLKIIYEDGDIIVVSKPPAMVVHPSFGHLTGTLTHALLAHSEKLSGLGGKARPGIVHRLDKDTSGLILVAKNNQSHLNLAEQLKKRQVKRAYLTLVQGKVEADSGTIDAPIGRSLTNRKKLVVTGRGGREAKTHFKVLERFEDCTLLELNLETGRTHQIRVHMFYIKHPVIGDLEYGGGKIGKKLGLIRQFLHASRLEFTHPKIGKQMIFNDPLPEDLQNILNRLRTQ